MLTSSAVFPAPVAIRLCASLLESIATLIWVAKPAMHRHLLQTRLHLLRRPRTLNWLPLAALVVVPARSMLVKCAVTPVPTPASVPAVLLAMLPIPTTAAMPSSLHSSGLILSSLLPGLAVAHPRSMPEASASPFATVTPIVPFLAKAAMAFTRTTVDRRWPEVAECFVAIR